MEAATKARAESMGYYESLQGTPFLYPHGLPFSEILARNVDALMERIRKKKAAMIVVDGSVGEGKTTLGVHIADYVNLKYGKNGHWVDLDGEHIQLAVGGKDFGEKLLLCHKEKLLVLLYDEAGDFDKKTTLSRFNRNLMRIFEMYRGFRILVVLCLPKFYKLENELFENGIPRLGVHTEGRTETQGNFRAFDLEQMYYIKHHAQKIIVKPKAYDFGIPNFYGHFLDLPPWRSQALDRLSTSTKRSEVRKTVLDVRNRVTLANIAKHFGMSQRWVLLRFKQLDDIGTVKTFERKKWYEKDIIKKIEELEEERL